MKKRCLFIITAFSLSACDVTQPIVSDFNGDSVKVATSSFDTTEYQRQTASAEADRICGKAGKKAEYASTTLNQQTYQNSNLYLCL